MAIQNKIAIYKIVATSLFILIIPPSADALGKSYPQGSIVHFETLAVREDVEFARKYLARYFEGEKPAAWDRAIPVSYTHLTLPTN